MSESSRKSSPMVIDWNKTKRASISSLEHVYDFNVKAITNALEDIVLSMNTNPNRALRDLQSVISHLSNSETAQHWLTSWVDPRGLDLLQCAIVNNRPIIVKYLLKEAALFPRTHFPKLNPYAHVAAMIGFRDCLEALLHYRPDDYFEGANASHAVRLPPDVMRALKLSDLTGMADKKLDKIVQSVKGDTLLAEKESNRSLAESVRNYENEIKEYKASFINKPKHNKPRKRFQYKSSATFKSHHPIATDPSTTLPHQNEIKRERKIPKLPIPKRLKKSKVTVHMDVFKDDSLDRTKSLDSYSDSSFENRISFLPNLSTTNDKPDHQCSRDSETFFLKSFSMSVRNNRRQENSTRFGSRPYDKRQSLPALSARPEIGIPKYKKYKDFIPVFDSKTKHSDDLDRFMGKTPLTLASERYQYECVYYLLHKFHLKRGHCFNKSDSLTIAAHARIPEAIAIILQKNRELTQYQNAVLLSLRELFPDSLNVLLMLGDKTRQKAFGGINLFHILYSQSLQAGYRCEMLPEMTRVLINNKENVNSRTVVLTYPLYTLIQSAFNVSLKQNSLYYIKCLKMLLNAKANPNFDEAHQVLTGMEKYSVNIERPTYSSAIHCALLNASTSFEHFDVSDWSQIIMQKCIETIEQFDQTARQIHHNVLFEYMKYVRKLGLNRRVLRALLRYGANPDYTINGAYALNVYFEEMIPFLTRFKVSRTDHMATDEILDSLLVICKAMSQRCLHESVIHFLDNHLLSTPLQALDLTRKFCYHANRMIISPRSLSHVASLYIWKQCRRNAKAVRRLPIPKDLIQVILP